MAYKTVLVALNEINRLDALHAAAASIAGLSGAHIRGLYAVPAAQIYPSTGFEAVPQMFEGHQTFFRNNLDKTKGRFEAALREAGREGDFVSTEGRSPLISDEILNYGRSVDLIIMSATDPADVSGVELDCVERVLSGAGRPVLVLPREGSGAIAPETVVVGWNGAREAARAVFDSVPLLKAAKAVHLVIVDAEGEERITQGNPGHRIVAALKRHDVAAEAKCIKSGKTSAGHALLNYAKETNAGLIVMGAYGHSRLREFVFGGATRAVLEEMTTPVLMSH
jgi:nucleotide-binding universal stress UspA family protein